MTYEPLTYWRTRGKDYAAKFHAEAYEAQEEALAKVFSDLDFGTVLEVGCGFGRIGQILITPGIAYSGLDLSPDLLEQAAHRLPENDPEWSLYEATLQSFPARNRKWDLVVAVEMLMHVPPDEIEAAVAKLVRMARRYVVTCDWTTPLPRKKTAAHNFLHDYDALFAGYPSRTVAVGLQTIRVVDLAADKKNAPDPKAEGVEDAGSVVEDFDRPSLAVSVEKLVVPAEGEDGREAEVADEGVAGVPSGDPDDAGEFAGGEADL